MQVAVAYADLAQQVWLRIEVPEDATLEQAIIKSGLLRQFPEIDLTRMGIYGGSAGGQNALGALLWHGDFYHVAVADCGCHDNRVDKVWWNEQWMGYPLGPHYGEQSNVTQAHRLTGKLLLVVGELVRFRFFGSSVRREDRVGTLLEEWGPDELEELEELEGGTASSASARRFLRLSCVWV